MSVQAKVNLRAHSLQLTKIIKQASLRLGCKRAKLACSIISSVAKKTITDQVASLLKKTLNQRLRPMISLKAPVAIRLIFSKIHASLVQAKVRDL